MRRGSRDKEPSAHSQQNSDGRSYAQAAKYPVVLNTREDRPPWEGGMGPGKEARGRLGGAGECSTRGSTAKGTQGNVRKSRRAAVPTLVYDAKPGSTVCDGLHKLGFGHLAWKSVEHRRLMGLLFVNQEAEESVDRADGGGIGNSGSGHGRHWEFARRCR